MAAKYYSLPELKQLALESANTIGVQTAYTLDAVENAYNFAVGLCGFENPTASDTVYWDKQRYLLMAMELYFFKDVQKRYLLKFDVGDLKLGQVSREVREIIDGLESSLNKARQDPATAYLFIDAVSYFGTVVDKTGINDDAIGQSINPDEVE